MSGITEIRISALSLFNHVEEWSKRSLAALKTEKMTKAYQERVGKGGEIKESDQAFCAMTGRVQQLKELAENSPEHAIDQLIKELTDLKAFCKERSSELMKKSVALEGLYQAQVTGLQSHDEEGVLVEPSVAQTPSGWFSWLRSA